MAYGRYVGSYSTLDPNQGSNYGELFTGYSLGRTTIGSSTSSQAVNQIAEVSQRLNEGMTQIEVSPASAYQLESMPKQHLAEIRRLASMSNAGISLHTGYGGEDAIDASGFTQQGWNESSRIDAERRMTSIVETGRTMNPKGNAVVTFHPTSNMPGTEYAYEGKEKKTESIGVIDVDSGKFGSIPKQQRFDPIIQELRWHSPEENIEISNESNWQNNLYNISSQLQTANKVKLETMQEQSFVEAQAEAAKKQGASEEKIQEYMGSALKSIASREQNYNENAESTIYSAIRETIGNAMRSYEEKLKIARSKEERTAIENAQKKLAETAKQWTEDRKKYYAETDPREREKYGLIEVTTKVMNNLNEFGSPFKINKEGNMVRRSPEEILPVPEKLMPIEDFALLKASQTFGNVAWKSFNLAKQDAEKAPIIAIENFQPGTIFSRADELKKLVKASRAQFVDNAIKSGMRQNEAEQAAEKLIGATWDVGHINLLRKEGLEGKELKEKIAEETRTIAPYAKHLHLTDNFGFADTHLAPGMGNVPIKEIMEEMEKAGYSGKAIVEAGNFAAQFKTAPHTYALEALGSPIYQGGGTAWQMGVQGSYFGGMGNFPEQHFSMYGSGFSGLPPSLGGAGAGGKQQSRFSGAPME